MKLTETEFDLLELLIENAGKTLSRLTILENIWGYTPERYIDTRLVDVYISKLRLKIEENPRNPDLILTVRGVGYIFQSI
jgi:OmpR family response regulator RpaB